MKHCILFIGFLLFLLGCSDSRIKFEKSYRTAKAIESALGIGVNQLDYARLLREFATEVSLVDAKSGKEKELLQAYQAVLQLYQDSFNLSRIRDCPFWGLSEMLEIERRVGLNPEMFKASLNLEELKIKKRRLETILMAEGYLERNKLKKITKESDYKNPEQYLCLDVVEKTMRALWVEASKKIAEIEKNTGKERNTTNK